MYMIISRVWLFVTQWTAARQASLSITISSSGSSVHGILQATILEWVAIPFFRGSSWSRGQTQVSCIAGRFFTIWATGKSYYYDFKQTRLS